jgi:hypothetical protein
MDMESAWFDVSGFDLEQFTDTGPVEAMKTPQPALLLDDLVSMLERDRCDCDSQQCWDNGSRTAGESTDEDVDSLCNVLLPTINELYGAGGNRGGVLVGTGQPTTGVGEYSGDEGEDHGGGGELEDIVIDAVHGRFTVSDQFTLDDTFTSEDRWPI